MAYKRILVPVDGSSVSERGLKEAVKLSRAAGGGRLRLLHVVPEYAAYASAEPAIDMAPVLDSLRAQGRRTLERIERRVGRVARVEGRLVENPGGRVADSIVDEARRWRADLIVMGTHGRRGVRRMLLGSDAELVIRYSRVPVLLVPARR